MDHYERCSLSQYKHIIHVNTKKWYHPLSCAPIGQQGTHLLANCWLTIIAWTNIKIIHLIFEQEAGNFFLSILQGNPKNRQGEI